MPTIPEYPKVKPSSAFQVFLTEQERLAPLQDAVGQPSVDVLVKTATATAISGNTFDVSISDVPTVYNIEGVAGATINFNVVPTKNNEGVYNVLLPINIVSKGGNKVTFVYGSTKLYKSICFAYNDITALTNPLVIMNAGDRIKVTSRNGADATTNILFVEYVTVISSPQ